MQWNNALDEVLGSKLKIRIIRTLHDSGKPMTGLKLARAVEYSHTQTYKALDELETLSVITKDYVGASHVYSINPRSFIVREILVPALKAEKKMIDALYSKFCKKMGNDLLSITLYGSVARCEDVPGSDIDLILVTRDGVDLESLEDAAAEASLDAALEFGGPVSAFVVPEAEYRRRLREAGAMWERIRREGITVFREDTEALKVG